MTNLPNFSIENSLNFDNKESYIAGCDEAGRGSWAGPIYAAAVILPINIKINGLNDSKKITEKKRDILFDEIINKAISYSIVSLSNKFIDKHGLGFANKYVLKLAVEELKSKPKFVLVDGFVIEDLSIPYKKIIKGDQKSLNIAAASILAKVSRDRVMKEVSKKYSQYGFENHKGYGTKLHRENLEKFGPCDIHRLSYKPIKEFLK